MKKRLFRLTVIGGMVTAFCYLPHPLSAQALAYAQNKPKVERSAETSSTMKLRDAILSLKNQFNVDILFEEKTLTGISVLQESVRTSKDLEKSLEALLAPNGLSFKKVRKNTYLIIGKKLEGSTQPKVTSNEKNTPSGLEGNDFKENNTISEVNTTATAEQTVTGKVVDDKGSPLPGASVSIKGTTRGVTTNTNGEFSINVADDKAVLVVTFIGFLPQEITVGNKTSINITLAEDLKTLTEVVVVGYGSQKKKDLTGSITSITSADFVKGNIATPEQLITGKLAGVQITSNGGAPGSASQIRIRGGSSLSASNDPLIVIDGVPLDNAEVKGSANPLSFINPNDIESFNVLKDASATAIYGSRASNGVIIITTKKGTKKDKFNVNFSSMFSAGVKTKNVEVLTGDQFREIVNARGTESQKALLGTANTNWQDQIFRTAYSNDNNLSITGVLKDIPYRVSVGHTNQNGILLTSGLERTSGSFGISPMLFNNSLKIDVNVKASSTKSNFADEGAIGTAIGFDPTQPVYVENQTYGGYFNWLESNGNIVSLAPSNPLALLNLKSNKATVNRIIANVQFDYKFPFLPALKANWNLGIDRSSTDGKESASNLISANLFTNNGSNGYYTQSRNNFTNQFYLNYVKEFSNQNINVMAGVENQGFVRDEESGTTFGNPTVPSTKSYFKTDYALLSYFGRVNYSLADKYLATFTLRRDGSSRFAENNRWGTFPSAALAWKINNEFKDSQTFSDLKLRLGWGITGQQDISSGDYPYLNAYTPSQGIKYQIGNTFYTLLRPNAYDPNIKWEQTASTNIGLDFGLKKSRISGSIDLYRKLTSDLINEIDVAAGTNFSNKVVTNVGSLETKGVEVIVNYSPILTENFNWDVSANFTYNQRKITALTKVDNPTYVGVQVGGIEGGTGNSIQVHSTGYVPNAFFVYKQVYDANGKPLEGVFEDLNGDGKITDLDRYRYKGAAPDYLFGFTSQMTYKKASFGFVLRSNVGNYAYNNIFSNRGVYSNLFNSGFNSNLSTNILETGFKTGTVETRMSDYYVQNASFLRMDNINLGYNLSDLIKIKNVRAQLSFIVQNVFVITNYKGLDPELRDGIGNQVYPRPRTYSLGLNVNF
ncbi:TonB-dependent receptor [Arcicella rosea]|uniref:Iron complex outermembrane receptor protein n=1 Tax=Arcicella rosea TaxID=502909 RepID=A0A841ESF9_9BACT|nr:TonB-dependent receptor [Arcicella rosea]MBB6002381.1 iron complex outermembrane receptor protein [Arcicella rosea]